MAGAREAANKSCIKLFGKSTIRNWIQQMEEAKKERTTAKES